MKNIYKVNEEAVKKIAERVYDNGSTVINRNDLEELFPELKESEDEKIREALINGFNKLDKSAVWYNGIINGQILAWLEKQGEHKPWSEEDENILNTIINHFKVDIECTDEDDIVRWLKSLKDRVQPQPKQEWSEEDNDCLNAAINNLEYLKYNYPYHQIGLEPAIEWLKSLRPQNRWKPSDCGGCLPSVRSMVIKED